MQINLTAYLILAAILFSVGLFGMLTRRNAVAMLLSIELMMLAVALNFVAASHYTGLPNGQVFAVFIIAIAAAEAAVGLALIITIFRLQKDVDLDRLTILKG